MSKRFQRGIWWVKRDFRLQDNDALAEAIAQCERVTGLFLIEPSLCRAPETSLFHYHAWQQAAQCLGRALAERGAALHVVYGEAVEILELIRASDGFDALFSHEETGSEITYKRDRAVVRWTRRHGIHWHEAHQNGVIRALSDRGQRQPIIKQRLFYTPPKAAPTAIAGWSVTSLKPRLVGEWPEFHTVSGRPADPRIALHHTQEVSEDAAQADWNSFLHSRGIGYSGGISSPNTAFTAGSRLSAHLAWGTISLRRVFHDTSERDRELAAHTDAESKQWRKSLRAFQSRLHWHDHFIQRLESAPLMEFDALNPAYRDIAYGDNKALLEAWETGNTGLPLIDACMRCLAATGFLNFRMRAMVVSAACFGLAQSWKAIHYPLARVFRDYEPGIHFSQIQMQAGIVGINTLRIYSPHKQLLDQDPQAVFVKRWIPELREFNATRIADYEERRLGDYPPPITDIRANTRVIRDQIYAVRKSEAGKQASADVLEKHGSRLPGNDRQRGRRTAGKTAGKTAEKALRKSAGISERETGEKSGKTSQSASRSARDSQLAFDFDKQN